MKFRGKLLLIFVITLVTAIVAFIMAKETGEEAWWCIFLPAGAVAGGILYYLWDSRKPPIMGKICTICNGALRDQDSISSCPACRIPFHSTHLKEWVETNRSCPSCAVPLWINEKTSIEVAPKAVRRQWQEQEK